jgi:SsrA-binding protein
MSDGRVDIKNRKAGFEFQLLEKYTAGIQLQGTEIKSIREGKVNISEGFCAFKGEELFIRNIEIQPYFAGSYYNHEPRRDRKLLLTKHELRKLQNKLKDKGLSIIPLRLFINDNGFAKLEISLAKGKKLYDKRQDIKKRDVSREIGRKI